MGRLKTVLGAVVLLIIFALYMCTFRVRFSEMAVLKTLGKFTQQSIIDKPGLYLKWPLIQSVVTTDARIRTLTDTYEESQTSDRKNIMATTYVCWRVDPGNPYKYHIASPDDKKAESNLKSIVQNKKKGVIAQYKLSALVNTNPDDLKFAEVEQKLRDEIEGQAKEMYGIDVVQVGIRRLSFPEGITEQVFESMKAKEEQDATKIKTEGQAIAQETRARASAMRENILAVADRLSKEIEAEANREVASYYKEFDKNVELRLFLDQLEATKNVLKERTTLVLDTAIAPFGLIELEKLDTIFKGMAKTDKEKKDGSSK